MADITMCKGGECPFKKTCYRYTALEEAVDQTFFSAPPFTKENGTATCKFYWDTEPGKGDESSKA